ncbi:MAG: class I SAM-dependent methyltransferase [Planctomycetes bacterium]|nr:class I SAM-dependent methyltransferase [Planctomycetota bacterium]
MNLEHLTVFTHDNELAARELAQLLSCSCDDEAASVRLLYDQSALALSFSCDDDILNTCKPISFSFSSYDMQSKGGSDPRQNLFRACAIQKNKSQRILDCCAGAGGDAFMMHSQGAGILSFERNPIVYHLLHDAMRRELQSDSWCLRQGDALEYITQHADVAAEHDVIYIDPMFRSERKRRAAEGKIMRALRYIAGDDLDSDQLIAAAASSSVTRLVIKRPLRSQTMEVGARRCSHTVKGKGHRLDVYL